MQSRLEKKMQVFLADSQTKHALISFCVANAATGDILYKLNEQTGMVPASNMKVFTSIAAYEILGSDYRFKTEIAYRGIIADSILHGNMYIVGYGDPTLGSWRYMQTGEDSIMTQIAFILHSKGIKKIEGNLIMDGSKFSFNPLPGGWTWEDMGNYYGSGTWGINWHENQYDMTLQTGKKKGDSVRLISTEPAVDFTTYVNRLTAGAAGSGDNSIIYLSPYAQTGVIEGTVPAGSNGFIVSGAMPEPFTPFAAALKKMFANNGIVHKGAIQSSVDFTLLNKPIPHYDSLLGTLYSPTIDSINYWFLKKSINIYGEDLVKTFALEKNGYGSTEDGVSLLQQFWQSKGIEPTALNVADGSGLSAKDHVTTAALVQALQYAKTRPWYNSFYNALPVYNGMHMKSGTIADVKSYSGYQTSASGKEYTFSMIVNNYSGSTNSLLDKMYAVLNELKK